MTLRTINKLRTSVVLFFTLLILPAICLAAPDSFSGRSDVKAFISKMVKTHKFKQKELESYFAKAKPQPRLIEMMNNPPEEKPWYFYQAILVTTKRIDEGVAFWKKNKKSLAEAEKKYGVPASIIVSLLGVETNYGARPGNANVFDALATLSFDYPRRAKFFKSELENLLVLSRDLGWNPNDIKGSHAGAIGKPQFMPSSYRHYAVSKDETGKSDLINSTDDAIFSVANYLKQNGWKAFKPIAAKVTLDKKQTELLQDKQKGNLTASKYSIKEWSNKGVKLSHKLSPETTAHLIELKNKNSEEYWLGFNNFDVITTYNRSVNYAMAVYYLNHEIYKKHSKKK